jgi:two-component system cell cycle response regulator DivK
MEIIDKQKRILVLDKNNRIQSVVDEVLYYGDWDVSVTFDPNAVYDKAKDYHPDLIILDYMLLDNDCAVICQDFKDDAELKSVPIIVVTNYKTKKARADFFKCDALFIKPLDMTVLASRMEYLMAS